jgi:hypothetical protein
MENRIKLTVNINPSLLKSIRLEAVESGISYSDLVAFRLKLLFDDTDIDISGAAGVFRKKYQHYGIFKRRGRPTGEFIKEHGPIFKKKATFILNQSLCRQVRRSARILALSVSDLVELSLKIKEKEEKGLRKTKHGKPN